jgi:hypothetical protein
MIDMDMWVLGTWRGPLSSQENLRSTGYHFGVAVFLWFDSPYINAARTTVLPPVPVLSCYDAQPVSFKVVVTWS